MRAVADKPRVRASLEESIDADRLLTSHEAAALIQANPSSVNKWVEAGRLEAFKTPGGHRRIRACDLVAFLVAHKMPVPARLQSVEAAPPVERKPAKRVRS